MDSDTLRRIEQSLNLGYLYEAETELDAAANPPETAFERSLWARLFSTTGRGEETVELARAVFRDETAGRDSLSNAFYAAFPFFDRDEANWRLSDIRERLGEAEYHYYLAALAWFRGDWEVGKGYLDAAQREGFDPTSSSFLFLQADLLRQEKRFEEACKTLERGDLSNIDLFGLYARTLEEAGEWPRVIPRARKLFDVDEAPPKLSLILMRYYYRKRDLVCTARHALNALLSDPWNRDAALSYGICMGLLGDFPTAELVLGDLKTDLRYGRYAINGLQAVYLFRGRVWKLPRLFKEMWLHVRREMNAREAKKSQKGH